MERTIGEIFEYNGEWYQVVECSKDNYPCIGCCGCKRVGGARIFGGECNGNARKDRRFVIFKKLEKVGEPYFNGQYGEVLQEYKYYIPPITPDLRIHIIRLGIVGIELKQNKEDMEEKKTNFVEEIEALCKRYNMSDGVRADFISEIKEIIKDKDKKHSLKPFDLEAAKQGKPVCTRDGRKARIICFDAKGSMPIVALISNGDYENLHRYYNSGSNYNVDNDYDLMMLPEKKEGWINVYKERIYSTKEEAIEATYDGVTYIDTVKISWEE